MGVVEIVEATDGGNIYSLNVLEFVEMGLNDTNASVLGYGCSVESIPEYYDKNDHQCKPRPQTVFYRSASSQFNDIKIGWRDASENVKKLASATNCSTYDTQCIVERTSVVADSKTTQAVQDITNDEENRKEIRKASIETLALLPTMESQLISIFATTRDKKVHVFEAHETLQDCEDEGIKENPHISSPSDKSKLYINHVNTLSLVGETTSLYVSYNTHYIFVSIKRKKWELDAMRRRYNLCQLYKNDTSNATLEMLTSQLECFAASPKEPRLPRSEDFLQIATLCLPSMECASLKVEEITSVEDRYYNNYGFEKIICPKGSFCKTGKHLCPVGFTCGEEGMSLPDRCVYEQTGNTHCFGEGLHEE